jgi:light-regulated signal transduction histidine kinase (bacteriophytochrome)
MLQHGLSVRYEFAEAEAAEDGLRMIREVHPDCILLDFRLPDLNGLEFLAEASRITAPAEVAIVMLTGQGDERVAAEAIKSGAQEYLSKGRLEADTLHTAIQSALRLSAAQRELESQRVQLERSNRDLERYARVVAHDLQAPLKNISAGLSGLRDRSGARLDQKSAEFVSEAIENAGRMAGLIRDILDYSRARADTTPFATVDMSKTAGVATANLREEINTTGATVGIEPLPTVEGNESQLLQLLQNLIGNAIKYRSRAAPVIRVRADRQGDHWRFAVADNGMGIDSKHTDRIFEPFIRLHPASEIEGTGVGLAICRAVVERHGGRIWVESEPGKGSTFYFTLPAQGMQGPQDDDHDASAARAPAA